MNAGLSFGTIKITLEIIMRRSAGFLGLLFFVFSIQIVYGANTYQNIGISSRVELSATTITNNNEKLELRLTFDNPDDIMAHISAIDATDQVFSGTHPADNNSNILAITRWITVPSNMSVSLEIVDQVGNIKSLETLQPSMRYSYSAEISLYDYISHQMEVLPSARIGEPRVFRGVSLVPLTIYPVQILDENSKVFVAREMTIQLSFTAGGTDNSVYSRSRYKLTKSMQKVLSTVTLNPPQNVRPRRDIASEGLSRMLILYGEDIEDESTIEKIMEFAEWKRRMGLVVDVEEVMIDGAEAEDIRIDYVEPLLDSDPPLEFLVIMGDDFTALDNTGFEEDTVDFLDRDLFFPSFEFNVNDTVTFIGDHPFSVFGEDEIHIPEIAVGRFMSPTYEMLKGALKRSIEYERNPYPGPAGEEGDWYSRALYSIENGISSASEEKERLDLGRWNRMKLYEMGYTNVDSIWRLQEEDIKDANKESLENGVSIALSDGWLLGCSDLSWDYEEDIWTYYANTGRMNPFVIAMGEFYHDVSVTYGLYQFFNSAKEDRLIGPVATLGPYPGMARFILQHTLAAAGLGIMQHDLHTPAELQFATKIYMAGFLEEWRGIDGDVYNMLAGELITQRTLGDPSIAFYTQEPADLNVTYSVELKYGQNSVVLVVEDEDDASIPDAVASIRQTGENDFQYVVLTNSAGVAAFTLPDGLSDDDLQITVHKHNYKTYTSDAEVISPDISIILGSAGYDDSDGDDDGNFRNGETVLFELRLDNIGETDAADVELVLSADSPHLTIDPQELRFGNIRSEGSTELSEDVEFTLSDSCTGGTLIRVQIGVFIDDEPVSSLAYEFETSGPILSIPSIAVDENFVPGRESEIYPNFFNSGDLDLLRADVTLISLSEDVEVINNASSLDTLFAGESSPVLDPFVVRINDLALNGQLANFALEVSEVAGYDTTILISKQITTLLADDPLGPDEYGYLCFDSGDTSWREAPEYNWREINWDIPGYQYQGTKLIQEFEDINYDRDNWDSSDLVELPFTFTYYGQDFDAITVNTNGWIAMGTEAVQFVSSHNQPIPGAAGPDAQIAVMWQDMKGGREPSFDGIFSHFIEEEGIFVIEWSNIEIPDISDDGGIDHTVSFQILLFDPEIYSTPTGDGEFMFQYKEYYALPGVSEDDIYQYSTIGVRNLDGTDGLQYSYWDSLSAQAHPVEDGFALKFTTTVLNVYGSLSGRIVREEDREAGIPGVHLSHILLPEIVTDSTGYLERDLLRPCI